MNQLRLTQKVQKAASLKIDDLHDVDETGLGLGSWTVNIFNQDRRKVLIFLNEKTLYSFILTGVRKEHYKNLPEHFCLGLSQLLDVDGFSTKEVSYLMQGLDNISYSKTSSKKVLGNLNNLIWHYQHLISSSGGLEYVDIGEIIYRLNRMPQRNVGWGYSVEAVAELAKNA